MLLTKNTTFILASSSEARRKISKKYNLNILIKNHKICEMSEKNRIKHENYKKIPLILAKKKAESLIEQHPDDYIIGSDQILYFQRKIYNKPKSLEEAAKNFKKFQGRTHELISSIYITKGYKKIWSTTKQAVIKFTNLSNEEINNYLEKNKKIALETVGSYKIESLQYKFITVIKGNKDTIMGFPIGNFINKL